MFIVEQIQENYNKKTDTLLVTSTAVAKSLSMSI